MKMRFEGADGRERLIQVLAKQSLCSPSAELPAKFADIGVLEEVQRGNVLIKQDDLGTEVFLILVGRFEVLVNGAKVNERRAGAHVGEIAAVDPAQRRSATVIAAEDSVVLKVSDAQVRKLAGEHPKMLEIMLVTANERLVERNALVASCNERPHVLIFSSKDAIAIAREVQSQLRDDDFVIRVWDQGVFKLSDYAIPSLERAFEEADFAIIVAQPEDQTITRGESRQTIRDNVTFEMGLSIGELGLDRTIILQPSDIKTDLASDALGLTTARFRAADPLEAALGPPCNDIRKHIKSLNVRRANPVATR